MNPKYFVISAMLFVFASCSGPSALPEMRAVIDERLAMGAMSTLVLDSDPVILTAGLGPALRAAVSTNEGYLGALALEREAMGQIGVAKSARRPQLSANANVGSIREIESDANDITTTGVAGGINLSQLVYDGGASRASMNRSTAMALSAQAERLAKGNEIALKAAKSWIDQWQYTERLRLMRVRASEMDTLVDQIERMASSGMLDRASVDSARRQIVDVKLEESRLLAGQSDARVLFTRYFKRQVSDLQKPAELVNAEKARALVDDWHGAPLLQSQAAQFLAARAAVAEARAAFRPRALFQAGARSPWEENESTDLTVGLSMEYSFNDGGRRLNQLASAEARMQAMDAQLTDAQRGVEADLQAALSRLVAIERSTPLLEEKLRLSRSESHTSRSQLMTGQSNLRLVVEAEIEVYRAQDRQIAMQAERAIILLTVAARTGALSTLIGLQDDSMRH